MSLLPAYTKRIDSWMDNLGQLDWCLHRYHQHNKWADHRIHSRYIDINWASDVPRCDDRCKYVRMAMQLIQRRHNDTTTQRHNDTMTLRRGL